MGRSKKRQEKDKTKPFLLGLVSCLVYVFVFRLGLPICLLPLSLAFALVLRGPLRYLYSLFPVFLYFLFPSNYILSRQFRDPIQIVSKSLTLSQYVRRK
jgi:hypothetical protein